MSKNLFWLGLSAAAFLLIHALTFHQETTELDDFILSRLSKQVRLIDPQHLESPAPLDSCGECLIKDPFAEAGPPCRWQPMIPNFSCRAGNIPLVLLSDMRQGGAQEIVMTLAATVVEPIAALKFFRVAAKLLIIFALFRIILFFNLSPAFLLFLCLNPMFYGMDALSWTRSLLLLLAYSGFLLVLSKETWKFRLGIFALLAQTYIWITSFFLLIPYAAATAWVQKNRRRTAELVGVTGLFLILRVAINFVHPAVSSEFTLKIAEQPIWLKSAEHVSFFLKDLYAALTLSADWVDFTPPSVKNTALPDWFPPLQTAMGLGVFLLIVFWGSRRLTGLFLFSAIPFFVLGHNNLPTYAPRFSALFPLAIAAAYFAAENCEAWIRKTKLSRLSRAPMIWIWSLSILTCAGWMYSFRQTGPAMMMNAAFTEKLSRHLLEKNITSPVIIHSSSATGLIDLISRERIRPLYLTWAARPPAPPEMEPADHALWLWTRVREGVLLQRTDLFESPGLTRDALERFAVKHQIEIRGLEFFPYRGNQGFWLVDFVNRRFKNSNHL